MARQENRQNSGPEYGHAEALHEPEQASEGKEHVETRDEADCSKGEGSQGGHEDSDSIDSAESKPVRLENMLNVTVEKDLFTIIGTKKEVESIPIKKVLITEK